MSVLRDNGGRIRVRDLVKSLSAIEEDEVFHSAVWLAIHNENEKRSDRGDAPLFVTSRDGEDRGWVRLHEVGPTSSDASEEFARIERMIREANATLDKKIRQRLESMDWRTFESGFLAAVLEKLGFEDVEITQATRDGGVDARVSYQRGVVEANAIVSAKHWKANSRVPVTEVRQLRGIQGHEDTAIIITTGRFTEDARTEARPSQNQRVVYLIDGDRLVDVCKQHGIGVRKRQLPELHELDELELPAEQVDSTEEAEAGGDEEAGEPQDAAGRRLRDEMLGDSERGLSYAELAEIVSLSEATVKSYLSVPARRRALFERLRSDSVARAKALRIVAEKRA